LFLSVTKELVSCILPYICVNTLSIHSFAVALDLFLKGWQPTLGPSQPPIQWLSTGVSSGAKQLEHEADHSPSSSVEAKNV
jgi:hypothetical protein